MTGATIKFGYAAQQEQYGPNELLNHAALAERVGFNSVWSSDHFHPWAHTKGNAAFTWAWLAALGGRTGKISLGTTVTSPIFRYNPAIVAQAFATLGVMYPRRVFLGVGTGEAMNEVPLGYQWPPFAERFERLKEAIEVIRALWNSSWVSYSGKYYHLNKANLYTKPDNPVPIYVASSGRKSASLAGRYGDGLLTLPAGQISNINSSDFYQNVVFKGVEEGAKAVGRDPDEIERAIAITSSYDQDYDRALGSLRFWGGTLLPVFFDLGVSDPRVIESHGQKVSDETYKKAWLIATSPEDVIKAVESYIRIGFTHIVLISSSPSQEKYINMIGESVLPCFRHRRR